VSGLVVVPVLLPLLAAGLCMLVGRSRTAQRVVALSALTVSTAAAIAVMIGVDRDGTVVVDAGDWGAPLGIVLVADGLATIMLAIATTTLLLVLVYAIGQPGAERNHVGFQSAYMILSAGVALSFLTGDLFTMFVGFEMMLTSSYVLMTLGGTQDQVRSGMTYVVISLVASVLFITALALIYMATRTVNLADLSERIPLLAPGLQSAFALLLLVVFGIKAAVFPLFFWLPDSYPTAPSPVTAIFAGLLTKVGVYALIRTQLLLFPESARPATVILWLAGLTMVVGVLGAVAQQDMKRILSFHIVSQIGYMVMGLGLFTVAGVAAAIYFIVHQVVVKTALFLTGGLVEHVGGSSRLSRVGGMLGTAPVLAVLFLVPALSLAGFPPMSGFIGKFALFDAGVGSASYWVVAAAVIAAFLTLFSMTKIWSGVFWNPKEREPQATPHAPGRWGGPVLMVVPTATLVVLTVALGVFAGPIYDHITTTAQGLLDPAVYRAEVLGR
jgi:multicomponent Na+:H+ antiporter subunit D